MRGIYFDGLNAEYREDLPMPIPAENQSLIKIEIAAVCSTDKEILKGYMPNFKGVMGHEFAGIVEQSNVPELIGKRVVGEIINKVKGVNRVCYDISSKPPSTIEWE